MMPQVHPVDLEPAVVECVDELMRERVLHVLLVHEAVLAHENAVVGGEAAGARRVAWVALHRRRGEGAAGELEVFEHEDDDWACAVTTERSEGGAAHLGRGSAQP